MIEDEEMREHVERGVSVLDQHVPDWRSKIKVETLEMTDIWSCVLGQVYGRFGEGVTLLGLRDIDCDTHGFDLVEPDGQQDFDRLKAFWVEKIEEETDEQQ